jgi:hypothetical protein
MSGRAADASIVRTVTPSTWISTGIIGAAVASKAQPVTCSVSPLRVTLSSAPIGSEIITATL